MLSEKQLAGYHALRDATGFVDLSPRSVLRITGEECPEFLNNFCTNDIRRLEPGTGCEAFVTSVQGKTLAFLGVYREADQITLETDGNGNKVLSEHLDKYMLSDDVELIDVSVQVGEFLVAGAEAEQRLSEHLEGDPPATTYAHRPGELTGLPVVVRRVPWTPTAWLLEVAAGQRSELADALAGIGATPCDFDAWNPLRIENGWPEYGIDITDANLPQEVDRDATAISFVKGCYLGQETVARIDALGHVNKILRGLKFTGDTVPTSGTVLEGAGKEAARVTSSCWSPKLERPIALAYVRRGQEKPGTVIESAEFGAAEVVALPFN